MNGKQARRDFLKASALAAMSGSMAWAADAPPATKPDEKKTAKPSPNTQPPAEAHGLSAYQMGQQIWIRWNNRILTSYRAHPTQKYPYFYPVTGPRTGLSLTTETSMPWPHHRSLLFSCDKVNKGNYWQGELSAGQVFSRGPKLSPVQKDSVEITDECDWHPPEQPTVLTDQRKFTIRVVSDKLRFIDAEIKWTAVQDVTIEKTNHALFSVRAAQDIIPWNGGTLINSNGQKSEKETFGQKASWACFYGKREGTEVVEGISLLDHPKNPWAPTPWFMRDYGFMSPMPFNFIDKPWQLPAGQSVDLRFRVVLHEGSPQEAGIEDIYAKWSQE